MKLRKLQAEEHIRTRELWENIFTEDTPEFLDYYYSVKTQNNEIYVVEDGERIVSMLHLNPYQMRVQENIFHTHYIVAVATDEKYRKQGLMRRLLNHAMKVMEERGEPFAFLMPVSEAIYKPFGFEFIYEQKQGKVIGKKMSDNRITFAHAAIEDCQKIADFVNQQLKAYDVVTWRTSDYYKMMLAEQQSEQGGILLAKHDNEICGVFCYAKEKEVIIRESLWSEDHQILLRYAVYHITGNETDEVICIGYGDNPKPMIMAKVLNPEICPNLKNAKVFINEVV